MVKIRLNKSLNTLLIKTNQLIVFCKNNDKVFNPDFYCIYF